MGGGRDCFGLGINWLQHLENTDDDQGRAEALRPVDLPPMFRPGRDLHNGGETVIESAQPREEENVFLKT